jgi:hypothetical protein
MKHLKTFESYKIEEYFDFDKVFDIDEDVLSYVFADLLDKYPHIGIELVEVDKTSFKVEIFDEEYDEQPNDMDDEFKFLKRNDIYTQIKSQFEVMDFKVTDLSYNKESNRIVLKISKLVSESNNPRKGMKSRWSVKYKRSINCSNPKGFSQKAYCARKKRGGHYKD